MRVDEVQKMIRLKYERYMAEVGSGTEERRWGVILGEDIIGKN